MEGGAWEKVLSGWGVAWAVTSGWVGHVRVWPAGGRGLGGCGQQWAGLRDGPRPHQPPAFLSAGIAVGFYGNGETSDGVHRATYSLRHANRTVAGVQDHVSGWEGGGCGCAVGKGVRPFLGRVHRAKPPDSL